MNLSFPLMENVCIHVTKNVMIHIKNKIHLGIVACSHI